MFRGGILLGVNIQGYGVGGSPCRYLLVIRTRDDVSGNASVVEALEISSVVLLICARICDAARAEDCRNTVGVCLLGLDTANRCRESWLCRPIAVGSSVSQGQ